MWQMQIQDNLKTMMLAAESVCHAWVLEEIEREHANSDSTFVQKKKTIFIGFLQKMVV